MTTPELNGHTRGGRWTEEILNPIFNDLRIASWAENELIQYNSLPKANSQERRRARDLVARTASQLLQKPQHIEVAADVWPESFYELVKKESGLLMKEKWKNVNGEQLGQLVKIYSNNDLAPLASDFAEDLLTSYFKGPDNRRQRVEAYYTFTLSVLDLVGDEKAFETSVRIGLYDTDILLKEPYLIDQNILVSLPNIEDKSVFQKCLISKYTMLKLSAMGSEDLKQLQEKEAEFIRSSGELQSKWEKEQKKAVKRIGRDEVMSLNNAMNAFAGLGDTLSIERNNDSCVNRLFNDPSDPLNQKFQEVLPRIAALKTTTSKE